ncbi:MAG: hypothetical protein NVS9B3_15490 [Gemmatimonadaceae bacterium]
MPALFRLRLRLICLVGAVCATACDESVVRWDEPIPVPGAARGATRLTIDARGGTRLTDSAAAIGPMSWAACRGSVREARASSRELHRVWWVARANRSAALLASRSDDGGREWSPPVVVDSADTGSLGCDRPPPAIAADSATGYVHVAYYAEPGGEGGGGGRAGGGGGGIFYAHSMDRGRLFHSPVAILFGGRPSLTAVAAVSDTVAVAFQDPNEKGEGAVALALSRTAGHIFEDRIAVSAGPTVGHPLVALAPAGGRVAVAWQERENTPMIVRVGQIRPHGRS